jgi:hypothetical protein
MSDVREVTFSIADVFDPDDEVCRWLTVLAMASNDFWRMFAWMEEANDGATRVHACRLQAAALYEAASHLTAIPRQWPKIQAFLAALPAEAHTDKDHLCGAVDPDSDHYVGDWIKALRNVTFHYPVVDPRKAGVGTEEITNALKRAIAQDIGGKITVRDESFGSVRFDFADEVAVQWLPDVDHEVGVAELGRMTEALLALARFVQRAVGAHLATFPPDVVAGLPDRPCALGRADA